MNHLSSSSTSAHGYLTGSEYIAAMAERGLAGAPREPPTRFVQGVGNVSLKIRRIGKDMEARFAKEFDPWLSQYFAFIESETGTRIGRIAYQIVALEQLFLEHPNEDPHDVLEDSAMAGDELEFIMQLLWDDQTAKTEERQMGSSSIPRSEVVEENIVVLMGRTKGKLDIEENFQIEPAYRGRGIGTWALRRLLCHESIRNAECRYCVTWPSALATDMHNWGINSKDQVYRRVLNFWMKNGFRRVGTTPLFAASLIPSDPHPAQRFPLGDINLDDLVGPPTPGRVAYHRTLQGFTSTSNYNGSQHHPSPAPRGTEHAPVVSSGLSTVTPYSNGTSPPPHHLSHHTHHQSSSHSSHFQSNHGHTSTHTTTSLTTTQVHARGHEPLHHHPLTDPESVSMDEFDQLDELDQHVNSYSAHSEVEEEMFRAVTRHERSTLTPYSDPDEPNIATLERGIARDREVSREMDEMGMGAGSATEARFGSAAASVSVSASADTSLDASRQEQDLDQDDEVSEENMSISQSDTPPPEVSFEEEDKFFDIPPADGEDGNMSLPVANGVQETVSLHAPIPVPAPMPMPVPEEEDQLGFDVMEKERVVDEDSRENMNGSWTAFLAPPALSGMNDTQAHDPSHHPLPSILKPTPGDSTSAGSAQTTMVQAHDAQVEDAHNKSVSFVVDKDNSGEVAVETTRVDMDFATSTTDVDLTSPAPENETDTSYAFSSPSKPEATSIDEVETAIVVDNTRTRTASPVGALPPTLLVPYPSSSSTSVDEEEMEIEHDVTDSAAAATSLFSETEVSSEPETQADVEDHDTAAVSDAPPPSTEPPSPSKTEPTADASIKADDIAAPPLLDPTPSASEHMASPAQNSVTLVADGDKDKEEEKEPQLEVREDENVEPHEMIEPEPTPDPNDFPPPVFKSVVVEIQRELPEFFSSFGASSSSFLSSASMGNRDENADVEADVGADADMSANVEEREQQAEASTSELVTPAKPKRRSSRKSMDKEKVKVKGKEKEKEKESSGGVVGSSSKAPTTPKVTSATPSKSKGKKKATTVNNKKRKAADEPDEGDRGDEEVEPLGPVIDDETGEVEWFIEDIVEEETPMKKPGKKRRRSHWDTMYRVRWKGYKEDVDSWMSKSELKDTEALERWMQKKKTEHTPSSN